MAIGLGSLSSMGIGLTVFMDDQLSGVANRVGTSLQALNEKASSFSQSMARLQSLGSGMSEVGDRMLMGAAASVQEFARIDDVMNSIRSIAQLENDPAGMKALTEQALTLGGVYGQMPIDIARAQLELAKGGKSQADILRMTEATVALGAGGEIKVDGRNGGAEILLNTMQGYNVAADQAMHFADIITSAAQRSTIDVTDFYLSMQYGAQAARDLKIPFEETAASIAVLGNAGFKGSKAGVAYQNMLTYLSKAVGQFGSKRQQEALGLLGIRPEDVKTAEGELINLSQLMELFRRQTEGLTGMNKLDIFQGIFGVRGSRGIEPLMSGMIMDEHGKMVTTLDDMQQKMAEDIKNGVAQKIAIGKTDDLMGDYDKVMTAWSSFKYAAGSALEGMLRALLPIVTSLLENLTSLFSSDFGKWIMRSGVVMGAALSMFGRIVAGGARLMIYAMGSAGRMQTAFRHGSMASTAIRANLVAGAVAIQNAAISLRGASVANMGSAGMMFRNNATGRLMGRATPLTRNLAMFVGARNAITFGRWIGAISAKFAGLSGFLGKGVMLFKALGGVLGTVFKWLFGWEVMIVDLIATMLTGKGVFEWIWEGLKGLGRMLGLFGEEEKVKKLDTFDARRDYSAEERVPTPGGGTRKSWNQQMMDKLANKNGNLTVIVNPTTGDERTERKIDLNHARTLQSNSIN